MNPWRGLSRINKTVFYLSVNVDCQLLCALLINGNAKASALVREQPDWEWTILRSPTLRETPAAGYKLCELSEVTSKHVLSRKDYAACLLDPLQEHDHHRCMLTVISANDSGCRPRD